MPRSQPHWVTDPSGSSRQRTPSLPPAVPADPSAFTLLRIEPIQSEPRGSDRASFRRTVGHRSNRYNGSLRLSFRGSHKITWDARITASVSSQSVRVSAVTGSSKNQVRTHWSAGVKRCTRNRLMSVQYTAASDACHTTPSPHTSPVGATQTVSEIIAQLHWRIVRPRGIDSSPVKWLKDSILYCSPNVPIFQHRTLPRPARLRDSPLITCKISTSSFTALLSVLIIRT